MVLVICLLFLFIGMYVGNRYNFKMVSINMIFGLFCINFFVHVIDSYSFLYINYHNSTFFYLVLGVVLGYLLMKLISYKYDETDNISIFGFSLINSFFLFYGKFNFLVFFISILYYAFVGVYIRKSSSWLCVLIGLLSGLFLSFFVSWLLGYVFTIVLGFIFYFILSVYGIVFKSSDKRGYYGLICGMVVALLGGLL